MKTFDDFGIRMPEILLPVEKNMCAWPVIACDQYTQDKKYWEKVTSLTKGRPSTFHLILPEIYLEDNKDARIDQIRKTMESYLNGDVFAPVKKCFVYIERTTPFGHLRKGLITSIDLETYDWRPFSHTNIRATEETIISRIPPRIAIRKGAPLELPHIMLLVDDKKCHLVERTGSLSVSKPPLYDIDLMCNGGSIKGWSIETEKEVNSMLEALQEIAEQKKEKDGSVFLFAVGDGNHSLATAKAVWDEYKSELKTQGLSDDQIAQNPVRWALVEVVNIYDDGLTFEPIHRVVFGVDSNYLLKKLSEKLKGRIREMNDAPSLVDAVKNSVSSFGFVYVENMVKKFTLMEIETNTLAVSALQPALEQIMKEFMSVNKEKPVIDYIHGSEKVVSLGERNDAIGILLPPVSKEELFDTIRSTGPLPKKSFSLGEADEKRFYLECRKLFPFA